MGRSFALLTTLAVALGLLASAPTSAAAAEADRTWAGLDVPYLSGGKVHFRGNAAREPRGEPEFPTSVLAMTATREAAVLQAGEEQDLFVLPAEQGRLRQVAGAMVGIPMADPAGDWMFWTASARGPGVRLMAYDTRRELLRRGPVIGRRARVVAVEGRTAYVGFGRVSRWSPGRPMERLSGRVAKDALLSDVDRGRYAVTSFEDEGRAEVRDADGAVLTSIPEDFAHSFDFSGRYLATYGGRVWDGTTDTVLRLQLGRWTPFGMRWAPSGELVVMAEDSRHDRYENTRARRFACDPATGACEQLPDPFGVQRYTVEHEPYDASAVTQLFLLIGS